MTKDGMVTLLIVGIEAALKRIFHTTCDAFQGYDGVVSVCTGERGATGYVRG